MPESPSREPVERTHHVARATPAEVYAVVTDFEAYPRLFPEFKQARALSVNGAVRRVEFRAQVVLAVRYVLDLVCDPAALTVDWTFVEGEIVTASTGGWRFTAEGDGVSVRYRASLDVRAPLPGFVLRKVTDGLVAASLPAMFASIDREVRRRQQQAATAAAGAQDRNQGPLET
jgi:ribosome-associated toxin RatA of RatAB toxin-antitoxin module